MPEIPGVRWEGFRRGIVAVVSFVNFEALRTSAHACRAIAPIEAVRVSWPRRRESTENVPQIAELRELTLTGGRPMESREVSRLANSPQLATLRVLKALGLDAKDLGRLAASPHLKKLRTLCLTSNGVGTAGVLSLTKTATLTKLQTLDLTGPGYYESYYDNPLIDLAGMEALADWKGLKSVRSLSLSGSDVRSEGLRLLLRSPHAAGLTSLSLRSGRLDGAAMAEFAHANKKLKLETLDLGENVLNSAGAENLAAATCLSELKHLRLDRCEIPENGAVHLAKTAPYVEGLRILEAGHNDFGNAGLEALLQRASTTLHSLGLRDNTLTNKGASLLAESPASNELLELDLGENALTDGAAKSLGNSPNLRRLLILRVGDNPKRGHKALASSPLGQRLKLLDVEKAGRWYKGYLPHEDRMEYSEVYFEDYDYDEDEDRFAEEEEDEEE
jgi:Ran GTPase-activating protein (RanGAP) involved in mRNA processing and transport